jgi:hypothetical protein
MGLLLVEGIAAALQRGAAGSVNPSQLRASAEAIAAGDAAALSGGALGGMSDLLVGQALGSGFGLVMLYGGIGAWILAGLSFALFRPGTAPARTACRAG